MSTKTTVLPPLSQTYIVFDFSYHLSRSFQRRSFFSRHPTLKGVSFTLLGSHKRLLLTKMINIISITLIGMLATAVTSTPFKYKRQYGQQVIFRTDLRADITPGVGQSPEFKNVYRKLIETPSFVQNTFYTANQAP